MKIHYVYLTTNLINGKQYIGDHTISDTKIYYIGSGRPYFQNAIKKYGRNNFFKEILEWFETREEAFKAQEKYIKQYNTLYPNGYNLSPKGGLRVKGCHSSDTRKKMSAASKGKKKSETHCINIGLAKKGNKYCLGLIRSEATRKKLSKSHQGKQLGPHSEQHKQRISDSEKGKILTKETKQRISKALKGRTWEDIYGIEGAMKRRHKNY